LLRRRTRDLQQLWNWIEYEKVEPFGQLRDDYHAAQVVSMIYNTAVSKEHQKDVETFLLKFGEKKRQTPEIHVAMIRAMAEAFAKIKD
jgi:hypothetical protein